MNKEEFSNKVKEAINQGIDVYKAILDNSFQYYNCIALDCSMLIDSQTDEPLSDEIRNHFFSYLHKDDINGFVINKKACLYIFELVSHNAEQVRDIYKDFCSNPVYSNLSKSAIKKNPHIDTNILYVGKIKKDIGKRMVTHFGFAHSRTGGLQLKYWAKDNGLQLKVHIIALDERIDDFINPLELNLIKNMKPLIGNSK